MSSQYVESCFRRRYREDEVRMLVICIVHKIGICVMSLHSLHVDSTNLALCVTAQLDLANSSTWPTARPADHRSLLRYSVLGQLLFSGPPQSLQSSPLPRNSRVQCGPGCGRPRPPHHHQVEDQKRVSPRLA
jgi:hypothetical protein